MFYIQSNPINAQIKDLLNQTNSLFIHNRLLLHPLQTCTYKYPYSFSLILKYMCINTITYTHQFSYLYISICLLTLSNFRHKHVNTLTHPYQQQAMRFLNQPSPQQNKESRRNIYFYFISP